MSLTILNEIAEKILQCYLDQHDKLYYNFLWTDFKSKLNILI